MPVSVFIGYWSKDEEDYLGFYGELEEDEYELLKKLAEESSSPECLSDEELIALSDIKDNIARALIKLYETEKTLSEGVRNKLEIVEKVIGKALASFNVFRPDAPHLEFLFTFCVIDVLNAEYDEETDISKFTFLDISPDSGFDFSMIAILPDLKIISINPALYDCLVDWMNFEGRRLMFEQIWEEEDEDAIDSAIEWWRDNICIIEEDCEYDITRVLFRMLRNNLLKVKRTKELVLTHRRWCNQIEFL